MQSLIDLLSANQPVILDGGLGSELQYRGFDVSTPLWSCALLHSNPRAIYDVHLAYLEAGAQIITTASYQASFTALKALGLSYQQAQLLMQESVDLALRAVEEYLLSAPSTKKRPLVAASIGPYGAFLADGSEYRGNYAVNRQDLESFHKNRLACFEDSSSDFLACETIPDIHEAEVLCKLLEQARQPAWISFSCRNAEQLNDGTPLSELVSLFENHPRVVAIGVNCTAPQFIEPIVTHLHSLTEKLAIVVYPNSGEHYNADTKTWTGYVSPVEFCDSALLWVKAGARVVGGCCRTRPSHIAQMARQLNSGFESSQSSAQSNF